MQTLSRQSNLLCEGEVLLMHILPFAATILQLMNKLFRIFLVPGLWRVETPETVKNITTTTTRDWNIPIGNILAVHKMHINKFSIQPKKLIHGSKYWRTIFQIRFSAKMFHLPQIKELCHCLLFSVRSNAYTNFALIFSLRSCVMPLNEGKLNLKYICLLVSFVLHINFNIILIEWIWLI